MHATEQRPTVRDLVAVTKPGITFANGLMAGAGLLVTSGPVTPAQASSVLVGTALVVAAANTLNMVLERDHDALMERTCRRPLASGRLGARHAWGWAALLTVLGGVVLALGTNRVTTVLGLAAVVVYAFVYTPLKRVTPWALHIGALAGAVPPLLGVTAVTPTAPGPGLALAALVFLWQFPHFLAIAVRRKGDYARAGARTWPIVHGDAAAHALARWTAILLLPLGLFPPIIGSTGWPAGVGLMLVGGWLAFAAWRPHAWVRPTFVASLAYLPATLALLAMGRLLG